MSRIRVLIVEDSAVARELLRAIIGADPRLEVTAAVSSAEAALQMLDRVAPDVIALDIKLPGMDGFEATRTIMTRRPTPIVLVSASVDTEDVTVAMQALHAGALAAVEKPVGPGQPEHERLAQRLCTQLAIMSQVRVLRQHVLRPTPRHAPVPASVPPAEHYQAVGIAASTGGPNALLEVLAGLGRGFTLPVFVVQHMAPSFLRGFAAWLAGVCPRPVECVETHTPIRAGRVYLCGTDRHLVLDGSMVRAEAGAPVCAHRPSATVLLRSMASSLGSRSIGVLLTGMGNDGAEGLRELREAGAYTIAEDDSTAVVYGMPAAAASLGGVCESLPLGEVALRILELVANRREAAHG